MARRVTDEQIAAFVDGHLEGTEAALVAAALSEDEEARAYAAEVERANGLLREAFGAPMGEAVPVGLRDSILQSDDAAADRKIVALAARRPARWPLAKMAIAAGVAVVIAVGASAILVSQMTPGYQQIASLGTAPADGPLHEALERLPSGAVSDAGVQPMLTFREAAGRICREFEVAGTVPDRLEFGIACRGDEGRWDVKIVVAAPLTEASPQGYRPASGPGADALEAMLDALGAQPVLGPAEESELLRRGWR